MVGERPDGGTPHAEPEWLLPGVDLDAVVIAYWRHQEFERRWLSHEVFEELLAERKLYKRGDAELERRRRDFGRAYGWATRDRNSVRTCEQLVHPRESWLSAAIEQWIQYHGERLRELWRRYPAGLPLDSGESTYAERAREWND